MRRDSVALNAERLLNVGPSNSNYGEAGRGRCLPFGLLDRHAELLYHRLPFGFQNTATQNEIIKKSKHAHKIKRNRN